MNPIKLRNGCAYVALLIVSLLPLALYLLARGYSCGHDLPFHLGSWTDAAQQLRRGTYPQWDYSAAYAAGEPRFIFYPPLSWLLGAVITFIVPGPAASEAFIVLCSLICGLAMFASARRFAPAHAAIVSAAFYALNPYMLFNALERAAYGELLASAWLPLLLSAALEEQPTIPRIAIPFALLWLSNVPTAIIGGYGLLAVAVFRIALLRRARRRESPTQPRLRRYIFLFTIGALLGMMLASIFLVPAIHQQHLVRLDAAFAGGKSYRDNFVLHHTAQTSRQVMHKVTLIAAELGTAVIVLYAVCLVGSRVPDKGDTRKRRQRMLPLGLLLLAAVVVFLLFPVSAIAWNYLPELKVLQFPWRLLSLLAVVAAFLLAIALRHPLTNKWVCLAIALLGAWALSWSGVRCYWQDPHAPDDNGLSREQVAQAVEYRPTSEYTPAGESNESLVHPTPGYWLRGPEWNGRSTTLLPAPTARAATSLGAVAPDHLDLELSQPESIVLNRRNYPLWTIWLDGHPTMIDPQPSGRIELSLPAGKSTLDLRWHYDPTTMPAALASLLAATAIWAFSASDRRKKTSTGEAGVYRSGPA